MNQITIKNAAEFRAAILQKINFIPTRHPNACCTVYENPERPELGTFCFYQREHCYEFGIGDYTIPRSFQLPFSNQEKMIRFGIVYTGTTTFKIHQSPVSSFQPSSFFIIEHGISGKQAWKRGQHFHGLEVTIYADYFYNIVKQLNGSSIDLETIEENYTYHYLPWEITNTLQGMQALSDKNQLNPVYLESQILKCIGILLNEFQNQESNTFSKQKTLDFVSVGTDRTIYFTTEDISSIQKAHEILTENIHHSPTIEALSHQIALNTQKLKAGFKFYYHMTIYEYTTSLRMTKAATLLRTTNMHIYDIAKEVGYDYSGNFNKKFKQTYEMSPLQYRRKNR